VHDAERVEVSGRTVPKAVWPAKLAVSTEIGVGSPIAAKVMPSSDSIRKTSPNWSISMSA